MPSVCGYVCLAKHNVSVQIENANRAYQNAKVAMYAKKSYPEPYRGNAGERRKTHSTVENPAQCSACMVSDIVSTKHELCRTHASKDASC
jgi:hypothetical protein